MVATVYLKATQPVNDGAGPPAFGIPVGAQGTVLTSNGAGSAPSFQAGAVQVTGARVTATAPQAIVNTTAALTFDTEAFDTGAFFNPATPTRFTAPTAGLYLVGASAHLNGAATVGQFWITKVA